MPDGLTFAPTLRAVSARLELDPRDDSINRGLRAFLPLDDTSLGMFRDISPFRRVSGAVNPRARVASPFGRASQFVSPNELINVGGPASLASSSDLGLNGRSSLMAMAGWVYLSSTSLAGAFFKIGSATGGFGLGVGSTTVDAAGGNIVALYEAVRWIPTGFAFSIGWHHVAISLNGSGHPSIYYDGRLIYSDTTGAPNAVGSGGAGYCYIGTSQTGGRFFTGTICGFRAWGRSVAAAEVLRLYRDPWAGTRDPAVQLFHAARTSRITYAFIAIGATIGAPSTGVPTLAQRQAFTAIGATIGAPTTGTPALAQIHAFTAIGAVLDAPTVGTPVLNASPSADRTVRLPGRDRTVALQERSRTIALPRRSRTVILQPERR